MSDFQPRVTDIPGATEPTDSTPSIGPPERTPPNKRLRVLGEKLEALYMQPAMIGHPLAVLHFQQTNDARLIKAWENYATLVPTTVTAWVELAETNPRVLTMLESIVEGSVIGTIIVNHVMMTLPFLPPDVVQGIVARVMPRFKRNSANGNGNGHPGTPG